MQQIRGSTLEGTTLTLILTITLTPDRSHRLGSEYMIGATVYGKKRPQRQDYYLTIRTQIHKINKVSRIRWVFFFCFFFKIKGRQNVLNVK